MLQVPIHKLAKLDFKVFSQMSCHSLLPFPLCLLPISLISSKSVISHQLSILTLPCFSLFNVLLKFLMCQKKTSIHQSIKRPAKGGPSGISWKANKKRDIFKEESLYQPSNHMLAITTLPHIKPSPFPNGIQLISYSVRSLYDKRESSQSSINKSQMKKVYQSWAQLTPCNMEFIYWIPTTDSTHYMTPVNNPSWL